MSYRVLLIDDNQLALESMEKTIPWAEHDLELVGCASNGIQGCQMIRSLRPDILISDIQMPEMDGLTMLERYQGYGLRGFYMLYAMSDETFSITCSAEPPEGVDRGWFMFFITLLDQCYWVASAGLGAVVGSVLPFSTEGVDFVMTAMFTVIFLNQWEKDRQHYSALIGLAAPLACLVVFGSSSFLLPSMGCILILLLALRKPIEKAEGTEAEKSGEEVGA